MVKTVWPSRTARHTTVEPINPAPPVTTSLIRPSWRLAYGLPRFTCRRAANLLYTQRPRVEQIPRPAWRIEKGADPDRQGHIRSAAPLPPSGTKESTLLLHVLDHPIIDEVGDVEVVLLDHHHVAVAADALV